MQGRRAGTAIGEVCRKVGISKATFHKWHEMKRLRQLEDDNGKLEKLVAGLSLDRAMLLDVLHRKL
jgi:putative transposase